MSQRFSTGAKCIKRSVDSVPFIKGFGAIKEVSDLQIFKEGDGSVREWGREG